VASLRSSASGQTLRVEGLSQLIRDLGKVDKDAKREVVNGLKDVAKIVADEAARNIIAKGLVDTGELLRKMRSRGALSVTQQSVSIKSTAKRRGYLYGGVYEYGRRGKRARPFLFPAADAKQKETERAMEHWLDTFLSQHNL